MEGLSPAISSGLSPGLSPLYRRVAGIDVHRMLHVVTVLIEQPDGSVERSSREFELDEAAARSHTQSPEADGLTILHEHPVETRRGEFATTREEYAMTDATSDIAGDSTGNAASHRAEFDRRYQSLLRHLRLKGMQPKTIEAYSHGIRRLGERFDWRIDALTDEQLIEHFSRLLQTHSWSSVKHDLYGYKFYCTHVLGRPWAGNPRLIKPPKVQRLPDIVTVEEATRLFAATRCLSYRVFFFTLYSMGLRLGEALALQVGDIDSARLRVHVRDAKGNRDRLVPLPEATLAVLRRFWAVHRNARLLFPGRAGGVDGAAVAQRPLDRAGVQRALREVVAQLGLKKTSTRTVFATAMRPI